MSETSAMSDVKAMSETAATHDAVDSLQRIESELVAWQARRADRFDPVRFRFIEALLRRALVLHGPARDLLETRIAGAMTAYRTAYQSARSDALRAVDQVEMQFPVAAAAVRQRFNAGDFHGVQQCLQRLQRSAGRPGLGPLVKQLRRKGREREAAVEDLSLDEMLRRQEQAALQARPDISGGRLDDEQTDELRAMRQFRDAWAKRVIEKAVEQAMEDAPEDAGPLNSHRLVIGAITQMRDISPDYLNRFVSYVDTLLWLEQAAKRVAQSR